jgi:2-C-methyl-D-erythritol 4-phosphate cytidylyltransferase
MQIIAPQVYNVVVTRMADAFRKGEADNKVIVPDGIRVFLSNAAIESLYLHHNANPGVAPSAGIIGEQIHNADG